MSRRRQRYADAPATAFLTCLATREGLRWRSAHVFSLLRNYGAPPLARTRVKRRQMPSPTRAVSPVFRASSHQASSRRSMRLCRPALRAALKGGRSPSTRVALALANPGLADGQGRRREVCDLRP